VHAGAAAAYLQRLPGLPRWVVGALLGRLAGVIAVNAHIQQALQQITRLPDARVPVVSAFSIDSAFEAAAPSPELAEVLCTADPLITSAIFLEPDYGMEDVVALAMRLTGDYPHHCIVVLGSGKNAAHVQRQLNDLGLQEHIVLAGNQEQDVCLHVVHQSRLFLRPTRVDGDSNSVREALALGVPVIATRTDFRPEGVLLYPPGDIDALEALARQALANPQPPQAARASFDENLRRIRGLYVEAAGVA
jgi:glycosyltransferase involved in cell wall biosynthesis